MSKVEAIKAEIEQLSLEERVELAALLADEFTDDNWDGLMKQAASSGKFAALNVQAETDLSAGRCINLDTCHSR